MKKLLAHIEHVFALIAASRKARLSLGDNARVLLADYGSNPVDHRIALEILDGVYTIELPTQVTTRILDLGANIGTSAIYFQRRFPNAHIACVEPSPGNLAMLERNRRLNALSVTIFDCAAGTESGRTAFFDTADPSCCALLPINRESASQVDIEGHERFLFADAPEWLFQVSAIVGEIHEGYGIAQVRRDLAPYGFDVSISSPPSEYGQAIFSAVARPVQLEKNTPVPMMTAGPVR